MTVSSLSGRANTFYNTYFHPLAKIPPFSERNKTEKFKVIAIVASYFTVIIPAMVIAVYAAMHLLSYLGRIKKAPPSDLNNFSKQKTLADKGNAVAQSKVGDMYRKGDGVKKDLGSAIAYYTKAAKNNDANAQYQLAKLHINNLGLPTNIKIVLTHLEAAAKQNHGKALIWLTGLHNYDHKVQIDEQTMEKYLPQAIAYFTEAAKKDTKDSKALFILGYLNRDQLDKSMEYLIKAVALGNIDAMKLFVHLKSTDEKRPDYDKKIIEILTPKANSGHLKSQLTLAKYYNSLSNSAEEIKYYTLAAKQNNVEAQLKLEKLLPVDESHNKKALIYVTQATKDPYDSRGNFRLAMLYKTGRRVKQDTQKAIEHYTLAATKHNVKAQLILAEEYEFGDDLVSEIDLKKSIEYYALAADQGDLNTQLRLARAYELGELGCTIDLKKSLEYYTQAADENHNEEACVRLAEAYEFGNLDCERDHKKALEYYTQAAHKNGEARIRLAKAYEFGQLGCEKNLETAKFYCGYDEDS